MMVSPSGVVTVVPTRGKGFGQIDGGYCSFGRWVGPFGVSPNGW